MFRPSIAEVPCFESALGYTLLKARNNRGAIQFKGFRVFCLGLCLCVCFVWVGVLRISLDRSRKWCYYHGFTCSGWLCEPERSTLHGLHVNVSDFELMHLLIVLSLIISCRVWISLLSDWKKCPPSVFVMNSWKKAHSGVFILEETRPCCWKISRTFNSLDSALHVTKKEIQYELGGFFSGKTSEEHQGKLKGFW